MWENIWTGNQQNKKATTGASRIHVMGQQRLVEGGGQGQNVQELQARGKDQERIPRAGCLDERQSERQTSQAHKLLQHTPATNRQLNDCAKDTGKATWYR